MIFRFNLHRLLAPVSSTPSRCPTILFSQTRGMKLYRERTVRAMYWRARSFDAIKYPERRRDERQEWNYRSEIFAFSRRLQENLSEETLRCIFTHSSYVNQLQEKQAKLSLPGIQLKSNSELIERGRNLIDQCSKPYLRHTFKNLPEDGIENITGYLNSDAVLSDIAKWIGCKDIILTANWPPSESTMADTLRATIAGIETDLGLERVRRFIVDLLMTYLHDKDLLDDVWIIPNPRETLQLILENSGLPAYEPRIMFQTGARTIEACHVVGIYVDRKLIGSSAGETLAIAEDCAAIESLRNIFDLTKTREPMKFGEASETINYEDHTKEHKYLADYIVKM